MTALTANSVDASIHFLTHDSLFEKEKPYAFRYGLGHDDVAQSNMVMKPVAGIKIENIRGREHQFTLESNGFEIVRSQLQISRDEFLDQSKLTLYFQELEKLLLHRLGASKVFVFRHGIRQRHPSFPVSTGKRYEYDQPTSVAHVDTTPSEMLNEASRQMELQQLESFPVKRMEWINIWKPLRGPLNDWPLTVCDTASVNPSTDLESADLLYPDLATENFQVYHSSVQKWYYLSDHMPDELMVFRQANNFNDQQPGVPHCSFFNPNKQPGEPPRESIEARALVFYD